MNSCMTLQSADWQANIMFPSSNCTIMCLTSQLMFHACDKTDSGVKATTTFVIENTISLNSPSSCCISMFLCDRRSRCPCASDGCTLCPAALLSYGPWTWRRTAKCRTRVTTATLWCSSSWPPSKSDPWGWRALRVCAAGPSTRKIVLQYGGDIFFNEKKMNFGQPLFVQLIRKLI